jgi:S-formylglutathione hydrolase FrmB
MGQHHIGVDVRTFRPDAATASDRRDGNRREVRMEPWSTAMRGRFELLEIDSDALRDNPLGDPSTRPLWVYTPPGYADETERRYPSVYVIQGFTGQVDMWWNREAFRRTFPESIDEVFASTGTPPAIVVLVDCWTSVGGSQYLNSPGTGRYMDYLCDEVVAFVDARFRTDARRERRGIQGKSSGGYGAMVVPMVRPDVFGALASHAGDALFEACYVKGFADVVRALRDEYGGSYDAFWKDFRSRVAMTKASDGELLEVYGYAAAYSADPDGTVRLPFDTDTGKLIDDVWARWLEKDPVRMVPRHADALRSMRAIWLDAGRRDEWYLDNGAVAVSRELEKIGVPHTLELFDAGHMSIGYRYPKSLSFLVQALAEDATTENG